ncbi:MAG: hypothetical protein OXC37_06170, partial [Bdellovibrionaceae bacterium]|nr:hypothetical protein [Pseudobdellovibrionaceae bacterium]
SHQSGFPFTAKLFLILFLLIYINKGYTANCKEPTPEDKNKSTFCFFSLNNPDEYTELKKRYKDEPLKECLKKAGQNSQAQRQCQEQFEKVEIKEFYGEVTDGSDKGSVKKRFRKMLETSECDSLIISGHHTGYFAGQQSIGDDEDWKLDLDFMEDLSCEPGCASWFSNVRSLFLMGCRTVRTPEFLGTEKSADAHTIRVIGKNNTPVVNTDSHIATNQAFSSNLAEHDRLSDRYLMMFPESSLYGWGEIAPGKGNDSHESLPDFIKLVGGVPPPGEDTSTDTGDILNFIQFMNNQENTCKKYGSIQWANHWKRYPGAARWLPTSCFLEDSKDQFQEYQKIGCDLTQALNRNKNDPATQKAEVKKAVTQILGLGEDGIRANFNRLMSLITNTDNKNATWYNEIVTTLKNSRELQTAIVSALKSQKMGFVRRADYLYFYKEIGWKSTSTDKEISSQFLDQLLTAFDEGKKTYNPKNISTPNSPNKKDKNAYDIESAHQMAIIRSINDNNLRSWLFNNEQEKFKQLKTKFVQDGWDDLDVVPNGIGL